MKRLLKVLFLSALAILISCSDEQPTTDTPSWVHTPGDELPVEIGWELPGVGVTAATRGLSPAQQETLQDICVLVFEHQGPLKAIRVGEVQTDNQPPTAPQMSSSGTFKVKLPRGTWDLVVLANTEAILRTAFGPALDITPIADKSYAAVTARIVGTIDQRMYPDGGTIPMWGELEQAVVSSALRSRPVTLTRALARVDVGIGQYDDVTGLWDGRNDDNAPIPFVLSEVYLVRPNNQYAVTPNRVHTQSGRPTVPLTAGKFSVPQSQSLFGYSGAEIVAGRYTAAAIYLPEADVLLGPGAQPQDANHTERPAVVIGGRYNASPNVTYYRLDFYNGQNLLDVLRNHLYRFNVAGVAGPGFASVAEAYNAESVNLDFNVQQWDQADLSGPITGKAYRLTLTTDGHGAAESNYRKLLPDMEAIVLASPSVGYRFKEWTLVSGGPLAGFDPTRNPASFTMPPREVVLNAVFELSEADGAYRIQALADPLQGRAVASRPAANTGGTASIMATPLEGYVFDRWAITGTGATLAGTTENPATVTVGTSDVTVTAHFVRANTITMAVNDPAGGKATASADAATAGTTVTVTAAPAAGYLFTGWSGASFTPGANANPASFTMGASAVTITANFKKQTEPLSVVSNNTAWGTASASPAQPTQGQVVTLTATPTDPARYRFRGWTVISDGNTPDDGDITDIAISPAYQFTMPSGLVAIRADFEPIPRTITLNNGASTSGTVTATTGTTTATSPDPIATAIADDRVTISATAATGWTFTGWSTTGISPAPPNSSPATFAMPSQNVNVTPIFARLFAITAKSADAAQGTAKASVSEAKQGTAITLFAAPENGYEFESWSVTNSNSGASVTIDNASSPTGARFTMPAHPVTATAKFKTATSSSHSPASDTDPAIGVRVVDLIWATRNVAESSTFAATVTIRGGLYQWNKKSAAVSPSSSNPWPAGSQASYWNMDTRNPCPSGWRVPTTVEFRALLNAGTLSEHADYASSGTKAYVISLPSGSKIVFPAVNHRDVSGALQSGTAIYWTSKGWGDGDADRFRFDRGTPYENYADTRNALSVRCVRDVAVEDPDAVVVGDKVWASRNVDESGKFAASPTDAGRKYSWNKGVSTASNQNQWTIAQNPCPKGWYVPTRDDFVQLLSHGTVSYELPPIAKIITPDGGELFFPIQRSGLSGLTEFTQDDYWACDESSDSGAYGLFLSVTKSGATGVYSSWGSIMTSSKGAALLIRCVRPK